MARHITEETKYYPLILLSFPLFAPHTLVEAEKFNIRYPSPDYPLDKMELIAELLDVPVTELLDDFNLFLYNDQGRQIRAKRESLGLTQGQYAKLLGVNISNLKRWENNKVQIFKSTWEKLFR